MGTDADSPKFAYLQVANALRADVADSALRPGDRIPSIRELADRFEVSVQTVVKALGELSDEGLIRAGSTRGYFVATEPPARPRDLGADVDDLMRRVQALEERLASE